MTIYMSPALIGVYRTVVAEANRYPDLGRTFYDCGPARATKRLAEMLEGAKARGEVRADDCVRVADHFVGLIRDRSEEHTSELQSLMRISYAVVCLKKKR